MSTFHSKLIRVILCTMLCLTLSCRHELDSITLHEATYGFWEWVSTTTPNGTITPKTVGYTKQMARALYYVPATGRDINYVAFYKNDTLQHQYNEANDSYISDGARNTVIVKYDTIGYLKWYIIPNSIYIEISQLSNPYSLAPDTIRSRYQNNPYLQAVLYPH